MAILAATQIIIENHTYPPFTNRVAREFRHTLHNVPSGLKGQTYLPTRAEGQAHMRACIDSYFHFPAASFTRSQVAPVVDVVIQPVEGNVYAFQIKAENRSLGPFEQLQTFLQANVATFTYWFRLFPNLDNATSMTAHTRGVYNFGADANFRVEFDSQFIEFMPSVLGALPILQIVLCSLLTVLTLKAMCRSLYIYRFAKAGLGSRWDEMVSWRDKAAFFSLWSGFFSCD